MEMQCEITIFTFKICKNNCSLDLKIEGDIYIAHYITL